MPLLKKYPNGVLSEGFVFTTGKPETAELENRFVFVKVSRPWNGAHVVNIAVCESYDDDVSKEFLSKGKYPLVVLVNFNWHQFYPNSVRVFCTPPGLGIPEPKISESEYADLRYAFRIFAKDHLFPNFSGGPVR